MLVPNRGLAEILRRDLLGDVGTHQNRAIDVQLGPHHGAHQLRPLIADAHALRQGEGDRAGLDAALHLHAAAMHKLVWSADADDVCILDSLDQVRARDDVLAEGYAGEVLHVLVLLVHDLGEHPVVLQPLVVHPHLYVSLEQARLPACLRCHSCRRASPGTTANIGHAVPLQLKAKLVKVLHCPGGPGNYSGPGDDPSVGDEQVSGALLLGGLQVCDAVADHNDGLERAVCPDASDGLGLTPRVRCRLREIEPSENGWQLGAIVVLEEHPVREDAIERDSEQLSDR
mmetsp:Transcript_80894/g.223742  ORF Transcript_80894/g.223742 Transcript_80894/m.223742 type:complete len:286 (+) Transcript_80894:708-1565(+)